jgi:hypothetical protein
MRTEGHTTPTPYRGRFVTGTGPACPLLVPRLCSRKIHCPLGLGGMSSGTTGGTIGCHRLVKSLAGFPIFKENSRIVIDYFIITYIVKKFVMTF